MTAFKTNDLVRVKPELIDGYTASVRKQVTGRIGRVANAFIPAGRSNNTRTVSVFWKNRRNGNENAVADSWLESQLELVR